MLFGKFSFPVGNADQFVVQGGCVCIRKPKYKKKKDTTHILFGKLPFPVGNADQFVAQKF